MPEALSIDVMIESTHWAEQPGAERTVREALQTAAAMMSTKPCELAIVLTDDSAIRALNRDWRNIDKPTNVLSFPAAPPAAESRTEPLGADADAAGRAPRHLGDIVIAYETVAREADGEGKSIADHLAHLAVHGFLHLVGQDHDDDVRAEAMEALERAILARLGISDPYAQSGAASTATRHA